MEQKEMYDKLEVIGKTTLRNLLKIIERLTRDGLSTLKDNKGKVKEGRQKLYKLLNSIDPTTSKFLDQKMDMKKAQAYFESYGIPFAFKKTEEGFRVIFRTKDKYHATKALDRIMEDMSKPSQFAKQVVQKKGQTTFEDRVEKSKAHTTAQPAPTFSRVAKAKGRK